MAKNQISDWSETAGDNTDVGGIGIRGTNAVSNFDGATREIMAQLASFSAITSITVLNRTALKAADTTRYNTAILREAGRVGVFKWTTGDFSALITADTQEGIYVKADAIASTSGAWVRSVDYSVSPTWFGAALDNTTNDRTSILAARTNILNNGGALDLMGGRTAFVGSTLTDLSGIRINAKPGSKIRGNVDLTKLTYDVPNDLDITIDSAGVIYDYKLPRGFKKPFAERALWLSGGDLIRDTYTRISPSSSNLIKEKIDFPASDTWTTDSLPTTSGDTVSWALTAGGVWHAALRPAIGGREFFAVFNGGDYSRGAFVRWSGGYVVMYAGLGAATVAVKDIGVAINQFSLTWPGSASHPQWLASNSEWGVRLYDEKTAAFTINGTEVYRFSFPAGALITDYGFGVFASAGALTAEISYLTERRTRNFGGQMQTVLAVFGDSKSSPFFGNWEDGCREALDGTFGIRCADIVNNAEAGANSLTALQKMQSVGLGVANYVVIYCGTNDIQSGSPLSSSIQNLSDMLDIVINGGRRPVVVIPPLWLNADQTPNGFATSNAQNGAPLRAAYRMTAANRGALVVDMEQVTGQILSNFVTAPDASDMRVRDRIHDTPFTYRLTGEKIAAVIASDIVKIGTPDLGQIGIAARYFSNSWTSSLQQPFVSVTSSDLGDRDIRLGGILEAGTKTDGTTIMALPRIFRPQVTGRFPVRSVRTSDGRITWIRVEINTDGTVVIYGMPSDDNYLMFGVIEYRAA